MSKTLKRYILICVIPLLFSGCRLITARRETKESGPEYYARIAEQYWKSNNRILLRNITRLELKKYPDNYHAAWYNALLMQEFYSYSRSLTWYLDFIEKYPETPLEYRTKWIELARRATKERRIRFENNGPSFLSFEAEIQENIGSGDTIPKLLEDRNNFFFLSESGALYMIKKINKKVEKLNFINTRDFALFNRYIFFNDSFNMIRYDLDTGIHQPVHRFETDAVKFERVNPDLEWVVVHVFDGDTTLIHYFDLKNGTHLNLPTNCIAQSPEFTSLVMSNPDGFSMLDLSGNQLLSTDGEFLGYNDDDSIIYYSNGTVILYDRQTETVSDLLSLPDIKNISGFHPYGKKEFTLIYDNTILIYDATRKKAFLKEYAEFAIFNTGVLYREEQSLSTYFVSRFDLISNMVFPDDNIFENMIYSGTSSDLFAFTEDNQVIIFNLSDIF
jgi:WD40 repeat protein